jgi:superfamily I DNA/RNA helicase
MVTVFTHSDIKKQIQKLYSAGGQNQKAAEKCKMLLWNLKNSTNPLEVIQRHPITNHGESRIKHCVKYDMPSFSRLVTIQDNGWLVLLFFGTHNEVDKWLDVNAGLTVAITDPEKGFFEVLISDDISDPKARINPIPDYSSSPLYEKLKHYWELLADGIPSLIQKHLQKLDTTSEEEEIFEVATAVVNSEKQELIFDVFMALRGGLVDEAKNRILTYIDELKLISELSVEVVKKVSSNDQYLNLDDLDNDDMKILMSNKNWLEWMLFMHPAQKKVVDKDFTGSARLLGVSGSGKTCVVVRRAVRLAQKYKGEKILILTLNESLSKLIASLVDMLLNCHDDNDLKPQIIVKSFWELCRELLIEYRSEPLDEKILGSKTHKHLESIDDVWEEFYKCENNNNDAEILFSFHQLLLARGVYPQEYMKQEFDWIRSFLSKEKRSEYLNVTRENRAVQFFESDRHKIITGLEGWENKMKAVGAIDYLGLTNELYHFIDKIESRFRCILVDEIQDFGTLELSIIRKLIEKQENDLFLCGDIAQQVYNKHHQIKIAGIAILPDAYLKILKNYRNSREILSASYEVFKNNVDELKYKSDDFEILNPEYANFSSPKPFLRKGNSLVDEFNSALSYLKEILEEKEKGCIAICDYSIFEIETLAEKFALPVLNGSMDAENEKIYLSDLEQTKGFEFDRMIIINVSNKVFPNPMFPTEEIYREISKFYVAMTRAKKELIVSYSKSPSSIFERCNEYFHADEWKDHVTSDDIDDSLPLKGKLNLPKSQYSKMIGKKFLYHRKSVGMSRELQNKLLENVIGKSVVGQGKKIGWLNMDELRNDILLGRDKPHYSRLFGPNVYNELRQLFQEE